MTAKSETAGAKADAKAASTGDLQVGELVLVHDGEAFYPAIVQGKGDNGLYRLRYRDYPDEPPVHKRYSQLVFYPPKFKEP